MYEAKTKGWPNLVTYVIVGKMFHIYVQFSSWQNIIFCHICNDDDDELLFVQSSVCVKNLWVHSL